MLGEHCRIAGGAVRDAVQKKYQVDHDRSGDHAGTQLSARPFPNTKDFVPIAKHPTGTKPLSHRMVEKLGLYFNFRRVQPAA